MSMLYAKCPVTGLLIETGVRSDIESLARVADTEVTVVCERCGKHQTVPIRELYLSTEEADAAA